LFSPLFSPQPLRGTAALALQFQQVPVDPLVSQQPVVMVGRRPMSIAHQTTTLSLVPATSKTMCRKACRFDVHLLYVL